MRVINYHIFDEENISLIYSGLNSISNEERKRLKNIAQSLIAIQDHPGTPIPDSISREIMRDSTKGLLKEVK